MSKEQDFTDDFDITSKSQFKTNGKFHLSGVSLRYFQCSKCEMKVITNGNHPNYNCKSNILDKDCGMYWMNEISKESSNER